MDMMTCGELRAPMSNVLHFAILYLSKVKSHSEFMGLMYSAKYHEKPMYSENVNKKSQHESLICSMNIFRSSILINQT